MEDSKFQELLRTLHPGEGSCQESCGQGYAYPPTFVKASRRLHLCQSVDSVILILECQDSVTPTSRSGIWIRDLIMLSVDIGGGVVDEIDRDFKYVGDLPHFLLFIVGLDGHLS